MLGQDGDDKRLKCIRLVANVKDDVDLMLRILIELKTENNLAVFHFFLKNQ